MTVVLTESILPSIPSKTQHIIYTSIFFYIFFVHKDKAKWFRRQNLDQPSLSFVELYVLKLKMLKGKKKKEAISYSLEEGLCT